MPTYTTNYNLTKIALTDAPPDITAINPNWDTLDTKLKQIENAAANVKNAQENEAYLLKTIFVSPSGNDNNAGTDENAPMKTIRAALDKYAGLPRVWIRCRAGTYTSAEQLQVTGYTSVLISAYSTSEAVTLEFPIRFVGGFAQIDGINISVTSTVISGLSAVAEFCGANFYITNAEITGASGIHGVFGRWGGAGMILNSKISGCNAAIRGETGAVISASSVTSDSNNTTAVSASNSIIACSSISAITATNRTARSGSGTIFNAGNLVGTTTNVSALATVQGETV